MTISKILNKISYINQLNLHEGVEYLTIDGDTHYFRDSDLNTHAFVIINNKVLISPKNKTHGDIVINHFNLSKNGYLDYEQFDKIYKSIYYSGRIWIDFKCISFWNSLVPEGIIYDVKKEIKKQFPNENVDDYYIEYGKK